MSEKVAHFTDGTWQKEVVEADRPVVVDFWAEWCAPCRMIAPTIEALADEFAGRAKIGKLNVDENGEVSERYRIRGIPTILILKNGEVVEQIIGVTSRENLSRLIEKYLN